MTASYVRKLVELRPTGLRSALGPRRVARDHDRERVEAACEHALRCDGRSHLPVARMLKLTTEPSPATARKPIAHPNGQHGVQVRQSFGQGSQSVRASPGGCSGSGD
jgi:hypothetical protein